MKRILQTLLLITASIFTAVPTMHADENDKESREQWAESQARAIAADLGLDEATSQKFIDTYRRYQADMWDCRPRKGQLKHKKHSEPTDAEAEQILKNRFEHQRKVNDIQEKYYFEYSKFLSQSQILKAQDLERKMFDRMFKQHIEKQKKHGRR